jgi:hypothetical protein
VRFKIECANEPAFRNPQLLIDRTLADYPDPQDYVVEFPCHGAQARYVRLTASRLRGGAPQKFQFGMTKIDVVSGGRDIAAHCPVSADPALSNADDLQQPTLAPGVRQRRACACQ